MIRRAPKVSEVLARRIIRQDQIFGTCRTLGGPDWIETPEAKRIIRRVRGLSDHYLNARADEVAEALSDPEGREG